MSGEKTTAPTKFCKDCKWVQRTWWQRLFGLTPYPFASCMNPNSSQTKEENPSYLVVGGNRFKVREPQSCNMMRWGVFKEGQCGENAIFFEPRE